MYDILIIAPVSLDHNIDCQGNEREEVGGAVVASGFAEAGSGNSTAVFTKLDPADASRRRINPWSSTTGRRSGNTCPIRARNLSGRTGRGDTAFAGYITERQRSGIAESLRYSTALVSLKMEPPGPFRGSRQDVINYMNDMY